MVSTCIITRNERDSIEKCLQHLCDIGFHKAPYEIVVVDTGSMDGSVEWLREQEDNGRIRFFQFEWVEDFSAARNYAARQATNDVILVIDSDEYIQKLSAEELGLFESQLESKQECIGKICINSIFPSKEGYQQNIDWLQRVYSKSRYHYDGKIHEQLISIKGRENETYRTQLQVMHHGYNLSDEKLKEKAFRNIRMLELEYSECESDSKKPYLLYQLGKSYYMIKDYTNAAKYFSDGLYYDLDPCLEYVQDMVETYGYALVNSGQVKNALGLEGVYDEFSNSADFVFVMGMIYLNNAMFDDAIVEFEKATHFKETKVRGVNSYMAYYNIGVIYECANKLDEAIVYYGKCGEYEPAKIRLQELTN